MSSSITRVTGRPVPVPGNDIDTDRIIPARYLRCVTFDGIGEHAFEDDRLQNPEHPFNQASFRGASILVAGHNFGCGSSREHAPQALMRWGIQAVVGGSFAEIFFGNCLALGIPCIRIDEPEHLEKLMQKAMDDPGREWTVQVHPSRVDLPGGNSVPGTIPDGPRQQLLDGTWDATAVLLEADEETEKTISSLPYLNRFA